MTDAIRICYELKALDAALGDFRPISTPGLAAIYAPRVLKSQPKAKDCLVQYSSVGSRNGKSCEFVTLSTYNPTVGCGILASRGTAETRFLWHEL